MTDYIVSEKKYEKRQDMDFPEMMGIIFFVAGSSMFLLWLLA